MRGIGTVRTNMREHTLTTLTRIQKTPSPLWVCAVTRRRFPVGASPTRQPLQPEATGEPLRHRQTKEAATDMFSLKPPRHIPTLPILSL
jgi:hypothetical protein